jgi:hypothetical protein
LFPKSAQAKPTSTAPLSKRITRHLHSRRGRLVALFLHSLSAQSGHASHVAVI